MKLREEIEKILKKSVWEEENQAGQKVDAIDFEESVTSIELLITQRERETAMEFYKWMQNNRYAYSKNGWHKIKIGGFLSSDETIKYSTEDEMWKVYQLEKS